jgi:sulfate transport system ATP-binding protein
MTAIAIDGVTRRFGGFAALDGITLAIESREFLALLGPSGSGKTTLLRILAGLDFPDAGRVRFGDRDMTDVPARDRRVGFVFQHYALFRHMTAAQNVGFGLSVLPRAERPPRRAIRDRARELLALVQIEPLADRYPEELSGGQRQRVALARALAIEPRVLLLDEPFGALDAKVRKDLRRWLRALHERTGVTSVFVTHDQHEALDLADRVAVLHQGRIEQVDTPGQLYDQPRSEFVHGFLGDSWRLPCVVRAGLAHFAPLDLPPLVASVPDGPATAFVRDHEIVVEPGARGAANATLLALRRIGPVARATLAIKDCVAEAVLPAQAPAAELAPGAPVRVRLAGARIFPAPQRPVVLPVTIEA